MTFAKPTPAQKAAGQKQDKTTIHYNSHLTLTGIPLEAYDYIVNGKPALEWIMEYYQITPESQLGRDNLTFNRRQIVFSSQFQFVVLLESKPEIRTDPEEAFKAQCSVDGDPFPSIDDIGEA